MAVRTPNINVFSAPQAVNQAESLKTRQMRNSLLGMEVDKEQELRRQQAKLKSARRMTENAGEAIQQLIADGEFEAAEQLRGTMRSQYRNTLQMVDSMKGWVDADNYKDVREQLIQNGAVLPEDMPSEYDGSFFDRTAERLKNNLSKITVNRPGEEAGQVLSQDTVYDDFGQVVERGDPYESATSRKNRLFPGGSGGKPWQMGASDTNAIGRAIGEFMGATFNPITGTFSGLNREQAQQVATLRERAAEIYNRGQGRLPHDQAVAEAVRDMGINLRQLSDPDANNPLRLSRPGSER